MASNDSGDLWFLQQPGADPNKQTQAQPPPPSQQNYQSPNPVNPFQKPTQSSPPQDGPAHPGPQPGHAQRPYLPQQGSPDPPPQQDSPYPQQQGSPYPQQQGGPFLPPSYPPPQYTLQQGSPYPQQGAPHPQQNIYAQPGPYTPIQEGYPQQQGSPYPQQGYPQQAYDEKKQFSDPNSQVGGEAASFYGSGPPPVVQPGPGPGGPGDRGFFDSAMQIAGVHQPPPGPDSSERGWFSSSKNPLDPPPKMFRRPAPGHYSYVKFQPMSVLAVSGRLQDGFALMPPVAAPGDLHPFVPHDVTEDDWLQFLKDFQKTAHLSPSDRLFQGMSNSFMKDKIPSAKIQKRMAENKLEPVGDYLLAWNHYFFHPRRVTVVLAMGGNRFSGEIDDYPPDVGRHTKRDSKEKQSHSSSRAVDEHQPRGSLLGSLREALFDRNVAPSNTNPNSGNRAVRPEDEESDSEDYSNSEDERDRMAGANRNRGPLHTIIDERRAGRGRGRGSRIGERRARRAERIGERRRERAQFVQGFLGNSDTGKERPSSQHETESVINFPADRFRLVLCYWDGQREVF